MSEQDILTVIENNFQERTDSLNERYNRIRWRYLVFFLVLFGGMTVLDWLAAQYPSTPSAPVVEIQDLRAIGPTALCVGDSLDYTYQVTGDEAGVLDVDATIWRRTPPQTVVYSSSRRIVLTGTTNYTQHDTWQIPHNDPLTGAPLLWSEGEYERRLAISTPSRNTLPAIASLSFSIKKGCE